MPPKRAGRTVKLSVSLDAAEAANLRGMTGLAFDTGALIALERRRPRMRAVLERVGGPGQAPFRGTGPQYHRSSRLFRTMLRLRILTLSVVVLTAGPACDESPTAPGAHAATFRVQACSTQTFAIRLADQRLIAEANSLIGRDTQPIVIGTLARGSGNFNEPWSWHMVPESVQFADAAIELCDGCPLMVEQDLDYWITTVGRFCPWSSRVVARID